ncbi:MAG: ATP-binding cassette domain-containing protein [Pirellula sp.]|jgi:ATP-binding cassette subfamily B protein
MQSSWTKLQEGQGTPVIRWQAMIFGVISALLLPALLIPAGWLTQLLFVEQKDDLGFRRLPEALGISPYFRINTESLSAEPNLLRVAIAIIAIIVVVFISERCFYLLSRRRSMNAALELSSLLLKRLFEQARGLAAEHGLSGQRQTLRSLIQSEVPRVRDAWTDWFRVFPSCLIQAVLALSLACCINIWFTALAILALVVGWGLYLRLEANQRKSRPVLAEQRRNAHEQLMYLCESSPLLESIDNRVSIDSLFDNQVKSFHRSHLRLADEGSWRSPWLLLAITVLTALLLFVLSIRVLEPNSRLHIGEVVVLIGSVIVSVSSLFRLNRGIRKRLNATASAEKLVQYLSLPTKTFEASSSKNLVPVTSAVVWEHVSFRDSSKQRLLDDVSMTLYPSKLTAIVSMDQGTTHSLSEMIMGFGKPTSGRIQIDGVNLIDLDSLSLRRNALLVNDRGPLLDGTVEENMLAGVKKDATLDLVAIAREARVAEGILNLVDGFGTILSSNDERLAPDQLFRLGIARALIKKPSMVVAFEPKQRVSAQDELDSLSALATLKNLGATLLVVPERLSTLRAADQIIVFQEGRVVANGTHQQLLESSELYRHFNYIRFSWS